MVKDDLDRIISQVKDLPDDAEIKVTFDGAELETTAGKLRSVLAGVRIDIKRIKLPEEFTIPESIREEFNAMVAEMRDPDAWECECGFPKKPCMRIMLRNGPPFPKRPCEPTS